MTTATATKWAFCSVDSTRDVVVSLHRSEETAAKKMETAAKRSPKNALTHLMYSVREVPATTEVGERIRNGR